jgi:hypothetical protein
MRNARLARQSIDILSPPTEDSRMKKFPLILIVLAMALLPACKAKKSYPDPNIGWHSADFSVVLGRLQRIPAKNPDDPPIWVIRFGLNRDPYQGQLALMPAEKLTGYNGGELIRIRGAVDSSFQHPQFAGTWYEVTSIRIWDGYRGQ